MHQRERGHLPALRPAPWTPNFSKSAPNLDKSRSGANSMPTSTTSRNILGKSHEGLNSIKSKKLSKHNKSLDTATATDSGDNNGVYDGFDGYDDDDDDDGNEIKGCFSFMRSDDSPSSTSNSTNRNVNNNNLVKGNKKLSLDSQRQNKAAKVSLNEFRLPQSLPTGDDDTEPTTHNKTIDDVPYDRIFYRQIQKSLDEIFARDDYNQQFVDQPQSELSQYSRQNRNSKSSNDLSIYNHELSDEDDIYNQYRFQPVGSTSKFKRECFFTNHSQSLDLDNNRNGDDDDDYSSSTHSTSNRQLEDSFNSLKIHAEPKAVLKRESKNFDERSNSFCSSDDASTPSRKSSVTFKSNPIESTNYSTESTSFSILSMPSSDTSLSQISNILPLQPEPSRMPRKFKLIQNYHDLVGKSTSPPYRKELHPKSSLRVKIDKTKQKTKSLNFKSIFKDFKSSKKKLATHSNSFYRKINDREKCEKLLENGSSNLNHNHHETSSLLGQDESISSIPTTTDSGNSSSLLTEEPQYDAVFYTRNFVLARQNDD